MFLIADLETTGLNEEIHAVCQIGAILCLPDENLTIVDSFNEYVYPPARFLVNPSAIEATQIDTVRVYSAETEDVVAHKFASFVKGGCKRHSARVGRSFRSARYVGFNAPFDLKFLMEMKTRVGIDSFGFDAETPGWLCLMRLTRRLLPKRTFVNRNGGDKYPKLGEACAHFGIELKDAHDALVDVNGARLLWLALRDRFGDEACDFNLAA